MIYQVKAISGYVLGVWGVCRGAWVHAGVHGYARVGTGMHGVCAGMHGCLWMRAGVQGGARGAQCGWVWPGVAECAQVGASGHKCA